MTSVFPENLKNFGFGFMRLPLLDGAIDTEQTKQMVDLFLEGGFRYFDTAHGYHGGKSEAAIRTCLTSRYPREAYTLTDKLTASYFRQQADIRPLFERQLQACGVEYFDYYLMHAQGAQNYEQFQSCRAYETALSLKAEGKIRHFGISFHDTAAFLEKLLTENPEIEVVQLQYNYVDEDDAAVQSGRCLELCRQYGKPVIVMEPVKGGILAALPPDAAAVFAALGDRSAASYALRYAAGAEGVRMTLSGMSSPAQLRDNLSFMKNFTPLSEPERRAVEEVKHLFLSKHTIACTACRYCLDGCPRHISIPNLFACLNAKKGFKSWSADYYYQIHTAGSARASDCIRCGQCEKICPQHLPIRELLEAVAETFEKKES